MKKLIPAILAVLLLIPAPAQAAKRVALVIGNSAYKASPLRNPVNDATDVAAALKGLGFEVILMTDADRRGMVEGVAEFGRKAQDTEMALFFYAGHGMQVNGVNYLIPVRASVNSEADVEFEAVQADRVLAQMEKARAKVNLVILDACRDNPFRSFRSSTRGLAVVRAVTGSVVVYATSPGDVAEDGGSGRNSPFTRNLLRHMATPGQEVKAMFNRVGAAVAKESSGGQVPWVSSSLFKDVYLSGAPSADASPPPPAPAQVAMASKPEAPSVQSEPEPLVESFVPKPTSNKQGDIFTEPTTGMKFVWVPGGCFQMGDHSGKYAKRLVHEVCLDGFWMGKCEVTNAQYRKFKPGHDSNRGNDENITLNGESQPVVAVTWKDIKAYTDWLSSKGNGIYRLPTEAEWEYSARAGSDSYYYWGNDTDEACKYENVYDKSLAQVRDSGPTFNCNDGYAATAPVGSFSPNAFGLHDMLGNVMEWCQDWFSREAYSSHSRNNPQYMGKSEDYVIRGGAWNFLSAGAVRSAHRWSGNPGMIMILNQGFRLVREP